MNDFGRPPSENWSIRRERFKKMLISEDDENLQKRMNYLLFLIIMGIQWIQWSKLWED